MRNRNRRVTGHFLLLVAFFTSLPQDSAFAQPGDAVGICPMGARMGIATGEFAGTSAELMQQPALASAIRLAVKEMPAWLIEDSLSTRNRSYSTDTAGVIVATLCRRDACAAERAYLAYSLPTKVWGGQLLQGRHVIEFGQPVMPGSAMQMMPADVSKAVICAHNLDLRN